MYTGAGFTSVTGVTPMSRGCHTSVTILYYILYIIYTLTVYSVSVNKSKQVSQFSQNNRLKKFLVFWYFLVFSFLLFGRFCDTSSLAIEKGCDRGVTSMGHPGIACVFPLNREIT